MGELGELVRLGRLFWLFSSIPDADYKPSQTSRMELFAKIFNGLKPLTTFSKAWSYMFDQALDMFVYRTREGISNLLRNGRRGARKWSLRREDTSLKLERYVTVERFFFINYGVFHDNHQYSQDYKFRRTVDPFKREAHRKWFPTFTFYLLCVSNFFPNNLPLWNVWFVGTVE